MILRVATSMFCLLWFTSTALAQPFRTIDGSGNNPLHATWGMAKTELMRVAPHSYIDGLGEDFTQPNRPNPRLVSNTVFAQDSVIPSARGLSSGVWQWGQFLDHDITFSHTNPVEPHMIVSPPNDPHGMSMIPMSRSVVASEAGETRQQENAITSYIDASNVYGSDTATALALRAGHGGRMLTSAGNLLPTTDMPEVSGVSMDDGGNTGATMFVAGDMRANEQLGLTAMHTLFVREHNRVADLLAAMPDYDPVADDDLIYLKARTIVGAQMQAITYNEFLPMLMGDYAPQAEDYNYDPSVNAGIANEFSTALFRVGHTMLNENLLMADEQGNVVEQIGLRDSFFKGAEFLQNSPEYVDKLLMGLATQTAQEVDAKLVDDVRNFLFAPHQGMGLDLAALNIERGRDHGLADYNLMRTAYADAVDQLPGFENIDLSAATTFDELDVDAETLAKIQSVYFDVDDLDPWVLALAAEHVEGTSLGALLLAGLADQFTRLRDGDAYFYMGNDYLWSDEVAAIVDFDDLHLMDIVAWNTEMKNSPMNFFSTAVIPEPTSATLLLLAVVGLAWRRYR